MSVSRYLAENLFLELERLAVHSLCFSVLPLPIEYKSEVTHSRERRRVCLAEHLFLELESLAVYSLCFSVLPLAIEHSSEVTHSRERLRVRPAEFDLSYLQYIFVL